MENNLAHYILMIAGIGLLVFVLTRVGHYYWSYRLNRWAAEQGFTLIKFRGAKFYEGPSAWLRSDSQSLFRVQVENKRGEKVNGWVMFGIVTPEQWFGIFTRTSLTCDSTGEVCRPKERASDHPVAVNWQQNAWN
jgi:hypothetical protein